MNYFKKATLISGWIAFAISLTVYIMTLEPSASLWDCGEYIATSYKMEVGHPPGAPFFMMLNRIFTIFALDTSSVAYVVNLASGVSSALTVAFLFWSIALLSRSLMKKDEQTITTGETWAAIGAAAIGALGYAFTDTFWFSAVEGEVYAQSSLFSAMVFWAILRWESEAHEPHANRWLVFVAYLMGLSIGVHLLNLLAIPAIVFVYYYKFNPVRSKKGWAKAFGVAVLILAFVLYFIIPQTVNIGAKFDVLFVNVFGLPVNSGLAATYIAILTALGFGIWRTYNKGKVFLNTLLLCVAVIIVGYGTYATVIIRAQANPPMNSNNPDNPHTLLSFLNREQYGNRPLIYGESYASTPISSTTEKGYVYDEAKKEYIEIEKVAGYVYDDASTMFFPRMYSSSHAGEYKRWGSIDGKDIRIGNKMVEVPTALDNLSYFFSYQLNYMYWRYFLWNFVGRQNDTQSQGGILHGNWLSGIEAIDEVFLGPQTGLPDTLANNKGRNTYYFLPFLLGMIGILYQVTKDRNNFTVVFWLFFMTGIAIILYLNQPPGQVRERDYAFAGSFYAFSIWMGLGVLWFFDMIHKKTKLNKKISALLATAICSVVPIILIAQNWDDHDRSNRYVTRDLGESYLEAALPGSIILPYGDNDTFPLWYNQEVEGVRTDVRIMNLSYLEGNWYAEQMRDKSYDSEPVELTLSREFYRNNDVMIVHDILKKPMTIAQVLKYLGGDSKLKRAIEKTYNVGREVVPTTTILIPVNKKNAVKSGIIRADEAHLALDTIELKLTGNSITRAQLLILDAISTADWSRALSFTQPSALSSIGIDKYLQIDGYSYRFVPFKTSGGFMERGRIDSEYLYDVLMNKFKFGNIKDPDVHIDYFIDYTIGATQVRNTFGRLAKQLLQEGDTVRAVQVLDRINEEVPHSKINYNYNSNAIIEALYEAGETEKADSLLIGFKTQVMQHINYFAKFDKSQAPALSSDMNENLIYLQNIYVLANTYGKKDIKDELEPYLVLLK